jgi:small conductance mechanosensitive channel
MDSLDLKILAALAFWLIGRWLIGRISAGMRAAMNRKSAAVARIPNVA